MKVLVVGGAGYVGSPLTYRLWEQGHDVTVFDRLAFGGEALAPLLGKPRFRLVTGDMRILESLHEIVPGHDAVCLLAAIVGEPACDRDIPTAIATNLHGVRNVLQAVQQARVPRFVFTSTCSNYGISAGEDLVTEEAPLRPLSTYSETKVQTEKEILAAASSEFHPTVLRLSTAFGVSPRMRFDLLVSDFTLAAVRDRKIIVFGEQFWRPFVHVADIAAAMELVLASDPQRVSGQVFNIGDNANNIQKIGLARLVQEHVAGTEIETVRREIDPRSYRVDFTKANEILGFRARWSLADGVREAHAALRLGIWPNPTDKQYTN